MEQPVQEITKKDGFATLLITLITAAVVTTVSVMLILLNLGTARSSGIELESRQAMGLADACAEEALQEIRDNTNYSGSDSLTYQTGSCSYTVSNLAGQSRRIESEGETDNVIRKVEIEIDQINPTINVTSWQEVAGF